METVLIGLHAGLGELGMLLFLWVLVELLNPTPSRVARAKIVAWLGTLSIFASWFVGGYYYVEFYGSLVKPVIKAGPMAWGHAVITETKEHVFMFLPFLAIFTVNLIGRFGNEVLQNNNIKRGIIVLCLLIVLIGGAMAGMGYLISSSYRSAVETVNVK